MMDAGTYVLQHTPVTVAVIYSVAGPTRDADTWRICAV
jgi:hypothetical protein